MPLSTLLAGKSSIQLMGCGGTGRNLLGYFAGRLPARFQCHLFDRTGRALALSTLKQKSRVTLPLDEADRQQVRAVMGSAEVVVVITSLAGELGVALADEIATLAQESGQAVGLMAIAPFEFEGVERNAQARANWARLKDRWDAAVMISNEQESQKSPDELALLDLFNQINAVALSHLGSL